MANWYASSGPVSVLPKTKASNDQLVWRWVSPKKTSRSGFFCAWAKGDEPQIPAPSSRAINGGILKRCGAPVRIELASMIASLRNMRSLELRNVTLPGPSCNLVANGPAR